jgi:hypothetical protein
MTTYKSKSGWEYEKINETINDTLSKNINNTIKKWENENYKKFKGDYKDLLNKFIKYITVDNKARNGGVVVKVANDYFVLKNINLNRLWSVQFNNIKNIYIKDDKEKEIKDLINDKLKNKVLNKYYNEYNGKIGIKKMYLLLKNLGYTSLTYKYITEWLKNKKPIENLKIK